jgi:hypothetical protein
VNCAPDVLPDASTNTLAWVKTSATSGSCTLTCHGVTHQAATYPH